ncbi:MAG: hypothetical protein D6731_26080 [Planctomycetota bacterium]|nr:MAG: hypothetical protein D6731_26080 [Planctomycetota bacterium]
MSAGPLDADRRRAVEAVVRRALERGHLGHADLEAAQAELRRRTGRGEACDLLSLLRAHYLRPEALPELSAVYRSALAHAAEGSGPASRGEAGARPEAPTLCLAPGEGGGGSPGASFADPDATPTLLCSGPAPLSSARSPWPRAPSEDARATLVDAPAAHLRAAAVPAGQGGPHDAEDARPTVVDLPAAGAHEESALARPRSPTRADPPSRPSWAGGAPREEAPAPGVAQAWAAPLAVAGGAFLAVLVAGGAALGLLGDAGAGEGAEAGPAEAGPAAPAVDDDRGVGADAAAPAREGGFASAGRAPVGEETSRSVAGAPGAGPGAGASAPSRFEGAGGRGDGGTGLGEAEEDGLRRRAAEGEEPRFVPRERGPGAREGVRSRSETEGRAPGASGGAGRPVGGHRRRRAGLPLLVARVPLRGSGLPAFRVLPTLGIQIDGGVRPEALPPEAREAHDEARRVLRRRGPAAAVPAFARACAAAPKVAGLWVERGAALVLSKRFEEAAKAFAQALALDEENGRALVYRALLPSRPPGLPSAVEDAERGLRQAPDFPLAYRVLADLRIQAGLLDDAERVLDEGVAALPNSAPLRWLRSELRARRGNAAGALEDLAPLARRRRYRIPILDWRSVLRARTRDPEGALADLDRLLSHRPAARRGEGRLLEADWRFRRGVLLVGPLRRYAEGEAELRRALVLAPGHPFAPKARALLRRAEGVPAAPAGRRGGAAAGEGEAAGSEGEAAGGEGGAQR